MNKINMINEKGDTDERCEYRSCERRELGE